MENLETKTQIKIRKKRKLQAPPSDPKCPYRDAITHAEAARILGTTVYEANIICNRRSVSSYKSSPRSVTRSRKEVLLKGFLWKWKDKGWCVDFDWALKITGMTETQLEEAIEWRIFYDKRYCTAMHITTLLYGES